MSRFLLLLLLCGLLIWPDQGEARSARRAFWASLLLPGWGQHYAGKPQSSLRFIAAELGLWGGYFALGAVAAVRRDNYRTYAAIHARAQPQGKDKAYFDDLGFYENSLQHNQFALYDDGPDALLYADEPQAFWEWDAETSRQRYRELRNASETAERQALFMTGIVVANHLISAIHAARSVQAGEQAVASKWDVGVQALQQGFNVGFYRRF